MLITQGRTLWVGGGQPILHCGYDLGVKCRVQLLHRRGGRGEVGRGGGEESGEGGGEESGEGEGRESGEGEGRSRVKERGEVRRGGGEGVGRGEESEEAQRMSGCMCPLIPLPGQI